MSLTSLLKSRDVTKKFKEEFPIPSFRRVLVSPPIVHRRQTETVRTNSDRWLRFHKIQPIEEPEIPFVPLLVPGHSGLIGTGFDYLLRFYVKRLNPGAITSSWMAEKAAKSLRIRIQRTKDQYCWDHWTHWRSRNWLNSLRTNIAYQERRVKKAEQILEEAKRAYEAYLRKGVIDKTLLKSALLLAQLDPFYRSGQDEYGFGRIDQCDLQDLEALIKLVDPRLFKARKFCVLNPTFGAGSRLVGNADADLLIDGTLIDVKTSKQDVVQQKHWHQLVGYYVLSVIGGVQGLTRNQKIQSLGIYFSRFGELLVVDTREVIDQRRFRLFVRWFIDIADR